MRFKRAKSQLRRGRLVSPGLLSSVEFREQSGIRFRDSSGRGKDCLLVQRLTATATGPDTDSHQGYTTDGTYHYTTHTDTIYKRNDDATWSVSTTNASPFASLIVGTNHLGDGQYYDNKLYVVAETWASCAVNSNQQIAVYNTSDLSYNTSADISAQGHEAAGLTIDSANNAIYVCSFCDGTKIWKYNLTTLAYVGVFGLKDEIKNIQGIYYKNEKFYLTTDQADVNYGNLYVVSAETGETLALYNLTDSATIAAEGIDYSTDLRVLMDTGTVEEVRTYILPEPSGHTPLGYRFTTPSTDEWGKIYLEPGEEGSISLRITPNSFYDFNSILDNPLTANTWESWIYSDGRIAWRLTSGSTTLTYTLPSATQTYDVEFNWKRNGANADLELWVGGILRDSQSHLWVTVPPYLYIGGGPLNTDSNITYEYIRFYDRVRSAQEIQNGVFNKYPKLVVHEGYAKSQPVISVVIPGNIIVGATGLAFTYTGFTETITDLDIDDGTNIFAMTNVVDNLDGTGTFDCPSILSIGSMFSSGTYTVTATASGTTESDTLGATFNPQTGYGLITPTGSWLTTDTESLANNWGFPVTIADQILPPDGFTVDPLDGHWVASAALVTAGGVYTFYAIDFATFSVESFTVNLSAAAVTGVSTYATPINSIIKPILSPIVVDLYKGRH